MVSSILETSYEEAEDSIADGGQDRGVDAVFTDERNGKNSIHIFQFKYVNSFDNTKCSSEKSGLLLNNQEGGQL
jgi:hypothetical protein